MVRVAPNICYICKVQEISYFSKRCAECNREKVKAEYRANPELHRARKNAYYAANKPKILAADRARREATKMLVLRAYGGTKPECGCCHEINPVFLCLDHIAGGGSADRKLHGSGNPFYAYLKKAGFPPGFQILCFNCNMAKQLASSCPHTAERSQVQ